LDIHLGGRDFRPERAQLIAIAHGLFKNAPRHRFLADNFTFQDPNSHL